MDIIRDSPDGRLEVNYAAFHDIISDAEARGDIDAYAVDFGTERD